MKFYKILLSSTLLLLSVPYKAHALPSLTEQSDNCGLCQTAQSIVYEDTLAFIIKKQLSHLKTSLLIVPKKHIASFNECNLDTKADQHILIHLLSLAQMLASRLTGTQSYRITINSGNELQENPHLCISFESNDYLIKA